MKHSYNPNSISPGWRAFYVIYSIVLFSYGSYGVWVNDLYVKFSKQSQGIHLSDAPAWVMYSAIVCACAAMLSTVIDHYDKRDNEANYTAFAITGSFVGAALVILSLLLAGA